jgi:hypothetical protein
MAHCRSKQASIISCKHWMFCKQSTTAVKVALWWASCLCTLTANLFCLRSSPRIYKFIQHPLLHPLQHWSACGSCWRTQHLCSSLSLQVHCSVTKVVTMSAITSIAEEDSSRRHVVPKRWNMGQILHATLLLLFERAPCLRNGHTQLADVAEWLDQRLK